jgi:molybdenum cofactor biosynthesis enzyme MoaA
VTDENNGLKNENHLLKETEKNNRNNILRLEALIKEQQILIGDLSKELESINEIKRNLLNSKQTVNELNFQSNTALTALRQDFDNSIRSEDCHRCWRLEDLGADSRRKNMIDEYHTRDTAVELKSLDINVTWACNLACVMCGPQWSSTWSKELGTNEIELRQLGRKSQKANPFMDQLDLTQIERVHFNGGEPLINNNHLDVLQRLHDCGSLSKTAVSYNTNGTVLPNDTVIDMWKQAKLVKLYFSIDATDQAFEYVRWPAKWLEVESNIKHMIDTLPSNVMFGLNVTVGCYNIFEITDVWKWFNETIRTNTETINRTLKFSLKGPVRTHHYLNTYIRYNMNEQLQTIQRMINAGYRQTTNYIIVRRDLWVKLNGGAKNANTIRRLKHR